MIDNKMIIRPLKKEDYYLGYLDLLEQLTVVHEGPKITYERFCKRFDEINSNVFVIEENNRLIASGTLLIEKKFIHDLGSVGHIEDIVVDKNIRGRGLGRIIIEHLVHFGYKNNCYKIILDCGEKNRRFYEKLGFEKKEIQMVNYLKSKL